MPKNLHKSLQDYLSKIKKQTPHLHFSHSSLSHTTSKIINGCKYPKSLSFGVRRKKKDDRDQNHYNEEAAATLEDIDRFLVENFKSLYSQEHDHHDDDHGLGYEGKREKNPDLGGGSIFDSPKFFTPPPDLCGSHRFFVSSASSGSLLGEDRTSGGGSFPSDDVGSTSASTTDNYVHHRDNVKDTGSIPEGVDNCIAILTVSPSPYGEFRRSMQEMIEARLQHNQRVDWDFMEELLFCYLRLNEKKQHRYILSAFADMLVFLRQN